MSRSPQDEAAALAESAAPSEGEALSESKALSKSEALAETAAPAEAEAPVPFRVERRIDCAAGYAEVRRYYWQKPLAQTVHAAGEALVVNMALTSRPLHTRVDPAAGDGGTVRDAGRLLVMIPGMPYHLVAPSGSLRSLHCAIACATIERIAGEPIAWATLAPFAGVARTGLGIEGHMMRIHDELMHDRVGRAAAIGAAMELACVELVRQFRHGRPARPEVHRGGLAAWRLRAIQARVHGDGPAPRVTELAGLCGLTERQLSRAFKAETGMTLGRYIDEATMERAHRLLADGGVPIGSIAKLLGFANGDSFTRSYRRVTGALPRPSR